MKYVVILLVVTIVGAIILWFFGPRLFKTIVLISMISPYEREIPGAPTILILGDSTGYGTGARREQDSIAGQIATEYPTYSIENNSVNGRTIGELVTVAKELSGTYDLLLLQIGGNDILQKRDINAVETELREIVTALQDNTNSLLMMSSGNVGGASAFSGEEAREYEVLTRQFRDMFMQVSDETMLQYVDLFIEPEDDPFIYDSQTYLAVDGLHPSSVGYAFWYKSLSPVLTNNLTDTAIPE